jgi:hypothetical protein
MKFVCSRALLQFSARLFLGCQDMQVPVQRLVLVCVV